MPDPENGILYEAPVEITNICGSPNVKKDLNTTRYGVDQAVQELVQVGKLVRIIPNNGKANHFYINDI